MDLEAAGLTEQPFPSHGDPLVVLSYESERAALDMLNDTYVNPTGLCLLQAPSLSGKSTLIRKFIQTLHEDCEVALVDCTGVNATEFLSAILRQFGYALATSSVNELLGLIRVFALQQAVSHEPPLLIVENTHEMRPDALGALCELASLRVNAGSALKIVIISDRSLTSILTAPAMEPIAQRLSHDFNLEPMSQTEATAYIHNKLRAAGSNYPDFIFPDPVCAELWNASRGWPGLLDRLALMSLAAATSIPVSVEDVANSTPRTDTAVDNVVALPEPEQAETSDEPKLLLTDNDGGQRELPLDKSRTLIGRSEHNHVSIDSRFISRHHTMLVRHDKATFVVDLNSTNGTFVNAKRVSSQLLEHADVITIGHHEIVFNDPYAPASGRVSGSESAATAILQNIDEMRNLRTEENTAVLPAVSGDLPSIQT